MDIKIKNAVELEIITKCNLGCFNCDRSCRQAPSQEMMSLGQIRSFIKESISLERNWQYIAILGGEPTLHPQFWNILKEFQKNKDKVRIPEIITNGHGKHVNDVLSNLPDNISVCNTKKQTPVQNFIYYNIAPIDFGIKEARPCWILKSCGYGLTRYGYYPCGSGAAIDRVFGFDIGIKKLKDLDFKKVKKQLKTLCRYCGHSPSAEENLSILFQEKDKIIETEKDLALKHNKPIAPMTKSWISAYKKYKKKKPKLSLY